jgi:hypothetical protein
MKGVKGRGERGQEEGGKGKEKNKKKNNGKGKPLMNSNIFI